VVNQEQRLGRPRRRDPGGAGQALLQRSHQLVEVNPAWPAEPIKRFSPGTDSGTFDYFIEEVMDPVSPMR
jgi:hypothetical protein